MLFVNLSLFFLYHEVFNFSNLKFKGGSLDPETCFVKVKGETYFHFRFLNDKL